MARTPVIVASHVIVPLAGLAANALLAMGSYRDRRRDPAATARTAPVPRRRGGVLDGFNDRHGAAGLGRRDWDVPDPGLVGTRRRDRHGGLVAPRSRPGRTPDKGESPIGWDAVISLALVLIAAMLFAIPSLLAAVKVVSDGPIYHLYFAARWWKAGRLILVAAPFGENAATYFPANGDLWFTWLMASWGGDSLAKIGQAPFLLLAGAAAYGCARSLGIGRSASLIADLLVRHVDAPLALLLRAQRRHDLRRRLPAGGVFLPPVSRGPKGTRRHWFWERWPPARRSGPRPSASSSCRR